MNSTKLQDCIDVPLTRQKLLARVKKQDGCWVWQNYTRYGYGHMGVMYLGKKRIMLVHRLMYRIDKGEVADGLVLDHLCRNRACINPDHLEPVTSQENTARGITSRIGIRIACRNGHTITELNTYYAANGKAACRDCRNARAARYYQRKKQSNTFNSQTV